MNLCPFYNGVFVEMDTNEALVVLGTNKNKKNFSDKTNTHPTIDCIWGQILPFTVVFNFMLTSNINLALFKCFLFVSALPAAPFLLPSLRPLCMNRPLKPHEV